MLASWRATALLSRLIVIVVAAYFVSCSEISDDEASRMHGYAPSSSSMMRNLQCQVCKTPELTGIVHDSCCNYETVDIATQAHFHPLLDELRKTPFFRYFKVDLTRECPFWQASYQCMNRDCSVCECPKEEIPSKWYAQDKAEKELAASQATSAAAATKQQKQQEPCEDQRGESALSKVEFKNADVGTSFSPWQENKQSSSSMQNSDDDNMVYVNLLENPERFTGYSGLSATRVWKAIYDENCFVSKDLCLEERVYFRLISGIQASINTHIALEYRFGEDDRWGVNTPLFVERVGSHPERLQNLYFTYLFVLRAVGRYREVLLHYDFNTTGRAEDDAQVQVLLRTLFDVDNQNYNASCRVPSDTRAVLYGFNETMLFSKKLSSSFSFSGSSSPSSFEFGDQRRQFLSKLENVSRIMDCVTCEKCRLWGKVQILGLATAVKILLADSIASLPPLHRNEIIALINVLHRLSESIEGVSRFRTMEFQNAIRTMGYIVLGAVVSCVGLVLVKRRRQRRYSDTSMAREHRFKAH
jgi:ERO1-like protein alpha